MTPDSRRDPVASAIQAPSPTRRTVRLPLLYVEFLAFAVLAAWLASIGMGPSSSGSLPASAPVGRQLPRAAASPTSVTTVPAATHARTHPAAAHEVAGAPVTTTQASVPSIVAPPSQTRVVVPRVTVVTVPFSALLPVSSSGSPSSSSSDSSSSDSSSASATTPPSSRSPSSRHPSTSTSSTSTSTTSTGGGDS